MGVNIPRILGGMWLYMRKLPFFLKPLYSFLSFEYTPTAIALLD
jgi:hypothetical protein